MANEQIAFAPSLYIDGFVPSTLTNTTLLYGDGIARDSLNVMDLSVTAGTIDLSRANGIGGLDTGTIAASTWYYVFAVGSSNNLVDSGLMISTSATAPVMPFNTDSIRLIDVVLTDSSAHFLARRVFGKHTERFYTWDAMPSVLSGGTAQTLTAIDLTGGVPPIANTPVSLYVAFTPATANDTVGFASYGSTATAIPKVSGSVAARVNTDLLVVMSELNSGKAEVLYINSAASGATSASVYGFYLSL